MRTVKTLVYTLDFSEIGLKDVGQVGGKNASPGELFNSLKPKGVSFIDGFATTAIVQKEDTLGPKQLQLAPRFTALYIAVTRQYAKPLQRTSRARFCRSGNTNRIRLCANRKGTTMGGDPRDVALRRALFSATQGRETRSRAAHD